MKRLVLALACVSLLVPSSADAAKPVDVPFSENAANGLMNYRYKTWHTDPKRQMVCFVANSALQIVQCEVRFRVNRKRRPLNTYKYAEIFVRGTILDYEVTARFQTVTAAHPT